MKTLLLCGYRVTGENEPLLGLDVLDQRIRLLEDLGMEIYTVISGPRSDEYLLKSKRIHKTELIFDTSAQPSMITNLRAGLKAAADHNVFAIPIEVPHPDPALWKFLVEEGRKVQFSTETDLVQAITFKGAPYHFGFPLFITRQGNKRLQEITDLQGLLDARLRYLHQVYQHEAELAPPAKPL